MKQPGKKFSRLLAVMLTFVLAVGVFPSAAFGASIKRLDDNASVIEAVDELTIEEFSKDSLEGLDQLKLSPAQAAKAIQAKGNLTQAKVPAQNDAAVEEFDEDSAYVEAVAESFVKPMGVVDFDDKLPGEFVEAFVWLQSLPNALERVYAKENLSVEGYDLAKKAGISARQNILRARSASLSIIYEYDEVFSGYAVSAPLSELTKIAAMPGVYAVSPVGRLTKDYIADDNYTTGGNGAGRELTEIADLHKAGIDGRGIKVGVVDSGIDPNHPDLQGSYVSGWNYTKGTGGGTNNMNYPDEDHGTHVSGTIASQGVKSLGVAPGVQLWMAQVFSGTDGNSGSNAYSTAALDDFAKGNAARGIPKVDVVNLSLGYDLDTAYDSSVFVHNNAVIAGLILAMSAGNNAYPKNGPYDLRNGYTLGIAGLASRVVTVAAAKPGMVSPYIYKSEINNGTSDGIIDIEVENGDYLFANVFNNDNLGGGSNPPVKTSLGYELYYPYPSTADMTDAQMSTLKVLNADLSGKILVVNRGQAFADYKAQAVRLHASGLIVLNRNDTEFVDNMDISSTPSTEMLIFSGKQSGRVVLTALAAGGTLYFNLGEKQIFVPPLEPTGFSSVGPVTETSEIKPDIIAPGFNILSTFLNGGYGTMGGTSMSSPFIAGVLALIKQAHPDETPAQIKARLMNTADPYYLSPSSTNNKTNKDYYYNPLGTQISVFEQGAGFVNPKRAVYDVPYVTVLEDVPTGDPGRGTNPVDMASFSFGNIKSGELSKTLTATVHDAGDYTVAASYRNDTRYSQNSEGALEVIVEKNGDTFDVTLDVAEDVTEGLYEGYITVTIDGKDYVLPWGAHVGDPPEVSGNGWLVFPDRPIQATYNVQNQDYSPYSSQNYIFFEFDDEDIADMVKLRHTTSGSGNNITHTYYLDLLLMNVTSTDTPANPSYRYQVSLGGGRGTNYADLHLSDFIYADGRIYKIATTGRANARNANGNWATSVSAIAAGNYNIALEFDDGTKSYYDWWLQLGVVFTSTRPTLTINNATNNTTATPSGNYKLTANGSTYQLYNYDATEYTLSGTIYSDAIAKGQNAGSTGFYWAGYYLLQYGAIIPLAQDLNVLEDSTYGLSFDDLPGFSDNPWICDEDGNFELTFNVADLAAATNSYALNYNINTTTGAITWVKTGSRHGAIGADAFDATLYDGSNFALIGSMISVTWTPYVRRAAADIKIVSVAMTNGTLVATIAMNGPGALPAAIDPAKIAATLYFEDGTEVVLPNSGFVYDQAAGTVTWTFDPLKSSTDADEVLYGEVVYKTLGGDTSDYDFITLDALPAISADTDVVLTNGTLEVTLTNPPEELKFAAPNSIIVDDATNFTIEFTLDGVAYDPIDFLYDDSYDESEGIVHWDFEPVPNEIFDQYLDVEVVYTKAYSKKQSGEAEVLIPAKATSAMLEDLQNLLALYLENAALVESGEWAEVFYTAETWEEFVAALEQAKEVLDIVLADVDTDWAEIDWEEVVLNDKTIIAYAEDISDAYSRLFEAVPPVEDTISAAAVVTRDSATLPMIQTGAETSYKFSISSDDTRGRFTGIEVTFDWDGLFDLKSYSAINEYVTVEQTGDKTFKVTPVEGAEFSFPTLTDLFRFTLAFNATVETKDPEMRTFEIKAVKVDYYYGNGDKWDRLADVDLSKAAATCLASTIHIVPAEPEKPAIDLRYDVNGDGKVNAADVTLVTQNVGKKASTNATTQKCDLNGDKVVDAKDVALIQAYIKTLL